MEREKLDNLVQESLVCSVNMRSMFSAEKIAEKCTLETESRDLNKF